MIFFLILIYVSIIHLLYICSLGFLSSAAFLFLRQVLGWKLGLGKECIGALSGLPHGLEAHFIWTSFGLGLVLDLLYFPFFYSISIPLYF